MDFYINDSGYEYIWGRGCVIVKKMDSNVLMQKRISDAHAVDIL